MYRARLLPVAKTKKIIFTGVEYVNRLVEERKYG